MLVMFFPLSSPLRPYRCNLDSPNLCLLLRVLFCSEPPAESSAESVLLDKEKCLLELFPIAAAGSKVHDDEVLALLPDILRICNVSSSELSLPA